MPNNRGAELSNAAFPLQRSAASLQFNLICKERYNTHRFFRLGQSAKLPSEK